MKRLFPLGVCLIILSGCITIEDNKEYEICTQYIEVESRVLGRGLIFKNGIQKYYKIVPYCVQYEMVSGKYINENDLIDEVYKAKNKKSSLDGRNKVEECETSRTGWCFIK